MSQNKNSLAITTGTDLALKNASKSLKITNKLLSEVDIIRPEDWQWWLNLTDILKEELLIHTSYYDDDEEYDDDKYIDKSYLYNKHLIQKYIKSILSLTEIELEGSSTFNVRIISNLADIAKLKNLKKLNLSGNSLKNIYSLEKLYNLTEIRLFQNEISDLSPLSSLINLRRLHLGYNEISDISPLSELTKLNFLWVYNNDLKDINGLIKLKNIDQLNLSN